MACAAIMRRRWRCRGWADSRSEAIATEGGMLSMPDSRGGCRYMNKTHSRGPVVGHSTARIVPSSPRSSVGA
jgi:hypothetical protein